MMMLHTPTMSAKMVEGPLFARVRSGCSRGPSLHPGRHGMMEPTRGASEGASDAGYGRPVSMLSRARVGYVVFQDEFQVVAEPFADARSRD
jgi:hypothetical protein